MRLDLAPISGLATGANPSLLTEWRVGAILQAIAVRDPKSGMLWLDIDGQHHPARLASGSSGPEHGERLQVRVLRNSPVLALETLSSSQAAPSELTAGVIADALRRYVPRQESPALLLANLAWLMRSGGANALPKTVLQAAAQLWQALPQAQALTDADGLENAVKHSGAFLEQQLASGRGAVAGAGVATDLKALMLALSQALHRYGARPAAAHPDAADHAPVPNARGPLAPLPAAPATLALADTASQQLNELSRQTEGALARLTTTQISNSTPDTGAQSLMIELPVRHEDRATVLRLRVERDGAGSRRGDGAEEAWTVEAAMDLGVTGALHARVTLSGRRLGVQLRAESAAVVDSLARHAASLEALLREAGLEVDRVVCLHGMPAGDSGARGTRLLDVLA